MTVRLPQDLGDQPALSCGLATVAIMKATIGAAILALPKVFGEVRLAFAAPVFVLITFFSGLAVWRTIQCKLILDKQAGYSTVKVGVLEQRTAQLPHHEDFGLGTMGAVANAAFGKSGIVLAGFGMIGMQLAVTTAYMVVMVETLDEKRLLGRVLAIWEVRLLLFFVAGALCMIRDMSGIAKLSAGAMAIYGYLLFALIYWGGQNFATGEALSLAEGWAPIRWTNLGTFLGTAVFAQESIVVAQYVFLDMRLAEPTEFLKPLVGSYVACGSITTFVGIFGYLAYGESIHSVFYMNFPKTSVDITLAEVILCMVLLATMVLQLYPVFSFLDRCCDHVCTGSDESESESESLASEAAARGFLPVLVRWGTVLALVIVAMVLPKVTCITGVAGGICGSICGFLAPSLCHIKLMPAGSTPLDWFGDACLVLLGVSAMVLSLTSTDC